MIATGGMDGDAGGFGDDYHVLGLVDDGYGRGGYGWFMSMSRVGYYVAVLHAVGDGHGFSIHDYQAGFNGVFLGGRDCVSLGCFVVW